MKYRIVRKPYNLNLYLNKYNSTFCNDGSCVDYVKKYIYCAKHLEACKKDTFDLEQETGRWIKRWNLVRTGLKSVEEAEQEMLALQSETISEWKFVDGVFKQVA